MIVTGSPSGGSGRGVDHAHAAARVALAFLLFTAAGVVLALCLLQA